MVGLDGKVAIVTGAGAGIGRATAQRLADEGARLLVNDVDASALAETLATLGSADHVSLTGDVSRESTARSLADLAVERLGAVDILVNNAGVHFVADLQDVSVEDWDRIVAINLRGAFLCCRSVVPLMVARRRGSIVNLASISASIGQEFDGTSSFLYNVTKAGMRQLAVSLATRYASDGVRVNAVSPGATRTRQIRHMWPEMSPEQEEAIWRSAGSDGTPLGRVGQAEEIAAAIAFLASEESSFITGTELVVDGGFLAR